MILNFLQTRNPPILPTLQQQPHISAKMVGGVNVAFDKNLQAYRNFGTANTDSLGSLIFQFFRYYGHEIDYENSVMSVRLGKVSTKSEKGWNLLQDNRLCVEEPFNTVRNLANTADDTSMRGIHIELRRAFTKLSEGDLDGCCEQYVRPQEEERSSEIFVPPTGSRPVIPRAPTQTMKAPKSNTKGSRHTNGSGRGSNGVGRRTSNTQNRTGYLKNLPFPMTTQELQMQQQHQQHVLHDELFRQYQYLQMQEQELRMQLQLQALQQGRIAISNSYPHIAFPSHPASESGQDDTQASSTNGNLSTMSAPLRQHRFGYTSPYLPSALPNYGMVTNPSSPLLAHAMPDTRRNPRRTSVTRSSAGLSSRAHSQPARSLQSPSLYMYPTQYAMNQIMAGQGDYVDGRTSSTSSRTPENVPSYLPNEQALLQHRQSSARRPGEYMGHYIGPSPPIPAYSRSAGISPVPSQVGLAIQDGGLSPGFFPRMSSYSPAPESPTSQPISDMGDDSDLARTRGAFSSPLRNGMSKKQNSGPLVIDSLSGQSDLESPEMRPQEEVRAALSASTSEDLAFDTPSGSDDQSHDQGAANHDNRIQTNGPDREVTPTGRPESLRNPTLDSNRSAMAMSTHLANIKSAVYKVGDPLSPVREDPTPPQHPIDVNATPAIVKPPNLSPAMKRMTLQEIPPFKRKDRAPEALSSKTNGIPVASADVPLAPPTTALVAQQSAWQTQGKKKKSKKGPDPVAKGSLVNGHVGDVALTQVVERKGG
jgi:Cid1 family poly A polymerase